MPQLILMNIKLNGSEVFDGGEDLHFVVFGMRAVLCLTETFVLETKWPYILMFFWSCIMNWLYINYQLDALIIIYS